MTTRIHEEFNKVKAFIDQKLEDSSIDLAEKVKHQKELLETLKQVWEKTEAEVIESMQKIRLLLSSRNHESNG